MLHVSGIPYQTFVTPYAGHLHFRMTLLAIKMAISNNQLLLLLIFLRWGGGGRTANGAMGAIPYAECQGNLGVCMYVCMYVCVWSWVNGIRVHIHLLGFCFQSWAKQLSTCT